MASPVSTARAGNESAAWVSLPLGLIEVGARLRDVDLATVANLAVAIGESGFFGAILVRPIAGEEGEARYRLVAGAHRLAAMRSLGRAAIPCSIRILSDDEALQIEIDENLVRRGLDPMERAEMLEARFVVWSRRFPQHVADVGGDLKPKRGRPSNSVKLTEFLCGAPMTMGFVEETAKALGLSKSTVERAWRTVSGLAREQRDRVRGTWIAKNEGVTRQLAAITDAAQQAAVVEVLLSGKTKSVQDALAYAAGGAPQKAEKPTVSALQAAFEKLWKAANGGDRAAVLAWISEQPALPGEWALIPSDAPEFSAFRARVNPQPEAEGEDLLGFDDE